MQERLKTSWHPALLTLGLLTLPAHGMTLGEPVVRSALGERFDARIPVSASAGEAVERDCFSLLRETEPGIAVLGEAQLSVEGAGEATVLRVRSRAPVYDPAVMLRVRVACPGRAGEAQRQYTLLLDPRPGTKVVEVPTITATLAARRGETLESIARSVFPRNRQARGRYLEAMRGANPAIASFADRDPLPEGASVALPDLRTFMRSAPASAMSPRIASREAPATAGPAPRRAATPPAKPVPRPPPRAERRPAPPSPTRARARAGQEGRGDFVLKLSSAEMDLSPSRDIDERLRSRLRERLLVLDADDQVAALLQMRENLRKLEGRVAELQLKLSTLTSLPAATAPAAPSQPIPAPVAAPEPAAVPSAPQAALPAPAPAAPAPAAPAPEAKEKAEPATSAPAASTASGPEAPRSDPGKPVARHAPTGNEGIDELLAAHWPWAIVALLVAIAALLAWRLWRRNRAGGFEPDAEEPLILADEVAPADLGADATLYTRGDDRYTPSSDVEPGTRLPADSAELRRRYIEERFPEITNRTIVLEEPKSIVKGARLFYEDGAIARAVELLQFAIEDDPGEVRVWLALFEIFRLERLTGEYASLARRFHEHHGQGEYWRKVQYFGREIDPGNLLYREDAIDTLQTIGPREAKRLAAATAAASFDPIAENWLDAPMDFENEVLANELRQALMAEASVTEQDLAPDPMPALRSVEMFTVA